MLFYNQSETKIHYNNMYNERELLKFKCSMVPLLFERELDILINIDISKSNMHV